MSIIMRNRIRADRIKGEYKCRYCDKVFVSRKLRRRHEREVHNVFGD